ncbi:hypothetical protein IWQ56_001250 [Coemansia nantahalensis]|nr:hypothetical protein IWQ56_001250 [Coemansia nantahalensis]
MGFGQVAIYGSGPSMDACQNLLQTLQSMDAVSASAQLFPAYAADISAPPPAPYGGAGMAHTNMHTAAGQPHNYPSDLLLAVHNGKVF